MDLALEPTTETPEQAVTVHGHGRVLASLRQSIVNGHGSQSYLLHGPPGVGKRTVGTWLAQALLCEADDAASRPCGGCRMCRLVRQGACPEVHYAETPLRVDSVREMTRVLSLAPAEGRCRVALVADVDSASIAAANALLKTLEEPPVHAVLVLTASDLGAVLSTIRSRCRVLPIRPLSIDETMHALESGWGVAADRALVLARLSMGRLGWAVSSLEEGAALGARGAWLDRLVAIVGASRSGRLGFVDELAKEDDLRYGLSLWTGWWRDVMLAGSGVEDGVVNLDRLDEVLDFARHFSPAQAASALRALDRAVSRLDAHVNAPLTLDVLMLDLPS